MAVTLTVSETVAGSNVSDALAAGGTGVDLGQVTNGSFAPYVDAATNNGAQILWIRHNAIVDPITDVSMYLADYTLSTGFTYGGPSNTSSALNLTSILAEGASTSYAAGDKNNSNGTASGLWMDMQWDVSQSGQFDPATARGSDPASKYVKVFGLAGQGQSIATAFSLIKESCTYYNGTTEVAASSPVDGQIGISTDSAKGNRAKIRMRIYLRQSFVDGGIFQVAKVIRYSHTA
jgi:hypothetical protein